MLLKDLVERISIQGDNLKYPGGFTSIPNENERDVIVLGNKKETVRLHQKRNGNFYVDSGSQDFEFKSLKDLVKFLNKNKFNFVGIDDR